MPELHLIRLAAMRRSAAAGPAWGLCRTMAGTPIAGRLPAAHGGRRPRVPGREERQARLKDAHIAADRTGI